MSDDATRSLTPEDDPLAPEGHEDPLAWEARNGRRAALAAGVAALCGLGGTIITALLNGNGPSSEARVLTLADTLSRAAAGRPPPPGHAATLLEYQGHHAVAFTAGGLLIALGTLAVYPPMAYLYRAARARGRVPRAALILAAIGAAGAGVGIAVSQTALTLAASDFVDAADHTNSAAIDAQNGPLIIAAASLGAIASVLFAVGFLLICLHAMRVGLLSRLMGVVGMFAGATIVIRDLDPFGAIRSFWLAALALLILGRLPNGRPPAWSVPEAVPWPTQQEVREQREAARRARGEPERPARRRGLGAGAGAGDGNGNGASAKPGRSRGRMPAPPAPQPRREDAAPGRAHPSSKKRKRKRRS
jgi:hypothetical protein